MKRNEFRVRAKIWLYKGHAGWHFVDISKKQSATIKDRFGFIKRGWGSIPVEVVLGSSTWKTSIFPDNKRSCYILALKADVRKKEDICHGDTVSFTLKVRGT